MATEAATGLPLSGVIVTTTASNDGSFVPDGTGLAAGDTSGADGRVVLLNAELGKGDATEVMATGPSTCDVPAVVALEAGVSSVALPCTP